ncbi:MAG: GNAT family protein [Bacteroidetes bacterium]|nr:GNAT family protein [Bacteroidota bacterium]
MNIYVSDTLQLVFPDIKYAEELHEIITNENERLREWLPWAYNYGSVEKAVFYTELTIRNFIEKKSFGFTILYLGKAVGLVGTHSIDYANKRTTIGYWLSIDVEGKGVMTECVKALLDFCFDELKLNRVEIVCATENLRSNRIAQKLNFQKEGLFKQYELHERGFEDVNYYAVLKENWKK